MLRCVNGESCTIISFVARCYARHEWVRALSLFLIQIPTREIAAVRRTLDFRVPLTNCGLVVSAVDSRASIRRHLRLRRGWPLVAGSQLWRDQKFSTQGRTSTSHDQALRGWPDR